jgi:rhomboid protease GluP
MSIRGLVQECRQFPATVSICIIWIAVFGAMAGVQLADGTRETWIRWLVSGIGGGHRFGDLTLREVSRGEFWRLLTCTFVHYSILHIGLNLFAMYQLGTLIESWYGSPQFVFIYGITGTVGNLIAVLIRRYAGWDPRIHSGGGSVVILGLVGLLAIVGWRLRTPVGALLYRQMAVVLVVTALLGIALPRYIDNWGHAGGALVGASLGFAHKKFLAGLSRPRAYGAGVLTAVAIALCGVAQAVADRLEAPARLEEKAMRRIAELDWASRGLALAQELARQNADVTSFRDILAALQKDPDLATQSSIRQLRSRLEKPQSLKLSSEERAEFLKQLSQVIGQVQREYRAERQKLARLRREAGYRRRADR